MEEDRDSDPELPFTLPPDSEQDLFDAVEGSMPEARGYEEIRELGRGGMARVLLAEDSLFDRDVAMKVALPQCQSDPALLRRFFNEARITGQLDHPAIPPVHDAGQGPDGFHFFTMKWVRGETLVSILGKLKRGNASVEAEYPLGRRLQILLKVSEGVAFAHDRKVVHRDLKPENVMVGRFGQVFVMDWGLAKVLPDLPDPPSPGPLRARAAAETDSPDSPGPAELRTGLVAARGAVSDDPLLSTDGTVLGTPAYMAPEQAAGKLDLVDKLSDVYSLGAILYEILTFHAPFEGESVAGILVTVMRGDIEPPRERAPDRKIPKELEAVCLKAMAKERPDRYGSVADFMEDLRAFLEHRPLSAYRYGFTERVSRWIQRHPAGALAGGTALLLLCIGGALGSVLAAKAESNAARAREAEALGREAKAEAEMESLRAAEAERREAKAEERAFVAEDTLEKGRRVSAVLRSANRELETVLRDLKRSFHSPATLDEKRRTADRVWERVEAFEETVDSDSASQAAWWALKGWLAMLGGREEEAVELLGRSHAVDPDVAFGPLFEAMTRLSEYLRHQPMPLLRTGGKDVVFASVPEETSAMRSIRQGFEEALSRASACRVWGETASRDFEEVLGGFRAVQGEDPETAERGLSLALALPEMSWLDAEILLARAKVRFLKGAFVRGIEDAESAIALCPEWAEAHGARAVLWFGLGYYEMKRDREALPSLESAAEAFGDALSLAPDRSWLFNGRGIVRVVLGEAHRNRREDPRRVLRDAVDDFTECLRLSPELIGVHPNLGRAYLDLADAQEAHGEDPTETYRQAVMNFDRILAFRPHTLALRGRARACFQLGRVLTGKGADPRPAYRRAIEDYGALVEAHPSDGVLRRARGLTHLYLGHAELLRKSDPGEGFRDAISDFNAALRASPDDLELLHNRGLALKTQGDAEGTAGKDPRSWYAGALQDFEAVLAKKPDSVNARLNRGLTNSTLGYVQSLRHEDPRETYRKAIVDLDWAVQRKPEDPSVCNYLGKALSRMGDAEAASGGQPESWWEKAAEAHGEAVRRRPGFWSAMADRGLVLEKLGRFEEALEDLEKALRFVGGRSKNLRRHVERVKSKVK